MNSDLPKVLHKVAAAPLLHHAMAAGPQRWSPRARSWWWATAPRRSRAPRAPTTKGAEVVVQDEQHGTAHAVAQAAPLLADAPGEAIVLYADTPLIRPETLQAMREARARHAVVVLGFHAADPGRYGRLLTQGDSLLAIREWKDASPEERAITLCNSGVICAEARTLFDLVAEVGNHNASGEYYLTDIVEIARARGLSAGVVICPEAETLGVNTRAQLADAEREFQARARAEALENGVTLTAPETVFFALDTAIGRDAIIGPGVIFGPGVTIESGAEIKGFLPPRRLPHQPRRRCRPLCPPAPRRRTGRGRACRQLRRDQERHPGRGRQGRPPDLSSAMPTSASTPTSAPAP
jgi:bifunctional UDP-N-acetylglucosamine pyrophosphorylase/glucosamine-1-phosphate N-acetyltransferase